MSLYRRKGTDFWWARFEINGREIRKSTGEIDRREAARAERQLRADYERKLPKDSRARLVVRLSNLGEWDVERWEAKAAALRREPEQNAETLAYRWRKLIEVLGDMDVIELKTGHLLDFVQKRSMAGASIDEMRRELGRLRTGLQLARSHGHIRELPDIPKLHGNSPPNVKRKGKKRSMPLVNQWLALLPEDARDEAKVIALTGLRRSEAKRLTWSWLTLLPPGEECPAIIEIPVPDTKVRRKRRMVACPQTAFDILRRRNKGDGKPLLPAGDFQKIYERAAAKLGLEHNITRRDLRTTLASTALEKGVDVVAVRDQLGHTTIETTNIYLDQDPLHTLSAAAAVEGALLGAKKQLPGTEKPAQRPTGAEVVRFLIENSASEAEGRAFESPIARQTPCFSSDSLAADDHSQPPIAPHSRHMVGTVVTVARANAAAETILASAYEGNAATALDALSQLMGLVPRAQPLLPEAKS